MEIGKAYRGIPAYTPPRGTYNRQEKEHGALKPPEPRQRSLSDLFIRSEDRYRIEGSQKPETVKKPNRTSEE